MSSKPNIVYFLSDQHNAEISGFAGDPYVRTPNIDSIAASGVVLDKCYCPSPLCIPSRSAMLTGLMPHRTGMYNNMQAMRSDKATLPMAMTVGGYETVLAGRMHFAGPDQRHGFEKRLVGDITTSQIGIDNEDSALGMYRGASGQNTSVITKSGIGYSPTLAFDDAVIQGTREFLRQRTDERPLFMIIGTYGPHCPYAVEDDLFWEYYDKLPRIDDFSQEARGAIHPAIRNWYRNRHLETVTKEDLHRVRAAYYGMITRIDRQVGEIMESVASALDMDNTIFIYGSDHGDCIGKHGLFWKTNFYEGSARVPMMFSWKNHFAQGARLTGPSSLLDVAPTLIKLGGCPDLPRYDGVDISPSLFTGRELDKERVVLAECYDIKGDNPSVMARDDRYKLTLHAGYDDPQLFDMQEDPDEDHDLGTDPAHKQVVERLSSHLQPIWNPQEALKKLDRHKKHYDMVRRFANIVKPEPLEEWRGDLDGFSLKPMER